MRNMKQVLAMMIVPLFFTISACKKKDNLDPNDVGGSADIALTEVGSEFSGYVTIGGVPLSTVEMTVIDRTPEGRTTFDVLVDLTGHPDSAIIMNLVPTEYVDAEGRINTTFDMKFTTEGIVDYFWNKQPWVVCRYDDEVGATYDLDDVSGQTFRRTVTEKTGQDDWPFVFFNIKTTKIEQTVDPNDDLVDKVIYRANHRFGLVYVQMLLKTGQSVDIEIVGWNAM